MSPESAKAVLHPLAFLLSLKPWRSRVLLLVVAGLISALFLSLLGSGLGTLEERIGALGWTLGADTTPEERIIIVTIDEKSISEVGPWPWPREEMARLVSAIDNAGATLQLHDIIYSEAKAGDEQFIDALRASNSVVLAQLPLQSGQNLRTGTLTHAVAGISCGAASTATQLPQATDFLAPHDGFSTIPKGHIAPVIASDGAIRKVPALVCVDGQAYPALALAALLQASGNPDWQASLQVGDSLFGPQQKLEFDAFPGLTIPLDTEGNLRISYASTPDVFSAISAVDLMQDRVDLTLLDGAWVLVGATAFSMDDIVPTPYNGATPGVELTARLLASLVDVAVPYTPRGANALLILIAVLFAGVLTGLAEMRGRFAAYGLPIAALLMPAVALLIHIEFLASLNIWLGWVLPATYSVLAASLLLLLELSRVRLERGRVFSNLSSYLPGDMAREIAYQLPSSNINATRANVTLLNADLRNFSAYGEARPPEESAAVLHFFFTKATEIVEHHGGRIHEFRGDGLLAVWESHDTVAAEQALLAAHALQESLHHSLLPELAAPGLEPLALGIGIEQGPVLIGSIGPAHRRSHMLLGDTVGITLRIQEMTMELAQPILIGECAARQLSDHRLESQGSYLLAGLKIPHVLFAMPPSETPRQAKPSTQPVLKVLSGGRK